MKQGLRSEQKISSRMGRPSPEETQVKMAAALEAAREVFSEKGYHATNMVEIAARAGVAKRSLYIWYADKASLFHACVMDAAQKLTLPELKLSANLELDLVSYAEAVLQICSTEYSIGMAGLLMREGRNFPEIGKTVGEGARFLSEPVFRLLIAKGVEQEKAEHLAAFFITSLLSEVQHASLLGLPAPDSLQNRHRADFVVHMFVNGISQWLPRSVA